MSDSLSSDFEDDNNWVLELETVLLENCDFFKLRSICQERPIPNHLRNEVWKICLNINSKTDPIENFNDLFDLPNQDVLHEDCCEFVANLPKDLFSNSIGFISDIEIVLTYFSRTYKISYEKNNGWLSILKVLCCELKLNKRSDLYNYFSAICHRFIPSSSVINNEIFSVFRLLLQYHDPELCSFLDTNRISPNLYAQHWFNSIFSSEVQVETLVKLWDIYFLIADPLLMFYLGLIVIINLKESLLEMRGVEKSQILLQIQSVFTNLAPEDIEDFFSLARHYVDITPKSFDNKFSPILFGNANKDSKMESLLNSLCMPISVHELLESKSRDITSHRSQNSIRYFLIDCRPADQYNSGHLSSAYFLDSSLLLSSPSEDFQTSVSALLATQQQALEAGSETAGKHICFIGTGRSDDPEICDDDGSHDSRIVNMVVAQFLQRMTRFVSVVHGGYRAIHEVLGPQCDDYFTSHEREHCRDCIANRSRDNLPTGFPSAGGDGISGNIDRVDHHDNSIGVKNSINSESQQQRGDRLLSRFSSALKTKSSRFVNYIVKNSAESISNHNQSLPAPLQQRRQYRTGKTYRNTANIFSIDDNEEDNEDNRVGVSVIDGTLDESIIASSDGIVSSPEMINLDVWSARPDVLNRFDCLIVDEAGALLPGHLLLTPTHLFVLKRSASRFDQFSIGGLFLGDRRSTQSPGSFPTGVPNSGMGSVSRDNNIVSIYRRRLLSSVVKITSKKRLPECLTFHFMVNDSGKTEMDRFVIEQAGEAARVIKIQVQKMIDEENAS